MNPVKLLLIDDDEDDRHIFEYALKAVLQPVEFSAAISGRDALLQLQDATVTPDYIFIDLHMPGMAGTECLEGIRKIERLNSTRVIIYSTIINEDLQKRAHELNAAHYLVKPYLSSELTQVLKEILSGVTLPFLLDPQKQ